jgi:hypothetical protein
MKIHALLPLLSALLVGGGCSTMPDRTPTVGAGEVAALKEKADAGDAVAQNKLGCLYQNGDGVLKDLAKALALYQKAAESKLAIAQYNLAFMYDAGLGVKLDQKLANDWYRKSADQGYAPAMLNLGVNTAAGEGAVQDFIAGMQWIDLARFFTQTEKDMTVKWRIRGAYDKLKGVMSKEQFEAAQKKSNAWYKEFSAKQTGARRRDH